MRALRLSSHESDTMSVGMWVSRVLAASADGARVEDRIERSNDMSSGRRGDEKHVALLRGF